MPRDDPAELLQCVPDDVIQGALLPRRLLRQVRAETMSARLELGRAGSGACCVALRRRDSLVASEDACIPVQGIDETLADSLLLPRGAMAALGLSEHQVMEVRLVGAHSLRAL
ncbi:hypothetical protein FNF27_02961 [Cafeteria roenbergensis]|uniref:Uncharacterized protein n=1 Tax=Cafeteria roenbergensis TaxID=33653 RepID=A0A5A8CT62_CAFRO|nr:hypothetical protein FNF29_02105 [Cafeteria roenbergensis]KAA0175551.1 hypothetical protein FNF27_02961 [Cafeteria roenbergensis]|eukprot:KAA0154961.1 hypothetical protein FNF29_02105 [Cafeteria roenbergensis]